MAQGSIPTPPKTGFTDVWLKNLKPRSNRFEIGDPGKKGLRLRVSPGGKKTFVWLCQVSGKMHRVNLGTYGENPGEVTLAKARQALDKAKESHKHGNLHAVDANAPKTVSDLADVFYKRRIEPHRKRPDEAKRILDKDVVPVIGKRRLQAVVPTTISGLVEGVVDRGAPTHAGKVLAICKQMFRFAVARGWMEQNPAAALDPLDLSIETRVRDRNLTADEIGKFWHALDKAPRMSDQAKAALRLLLLTGVRSGELLKAKWVDVDLDNARWTIPVANQKLTKKQAEKARPFVIPLPPMAVALFEDLKGMADKSEWVMASDAEEGHYTDKALGRANRRLLTLKVERDGEKVPLLDIPPYSPHDLRRTMRSRMGENLRVPPHVAERCLNHSLGRIADTYDQGDYIEERADALLRWADFVLRAVSGKNVVELRA